MTSAYHHVGVRVSDLGAATEFYQGAFGAQVLVEPYTVSGTLADRITGHPGATMHMCQLGFDGAEGGFVELFRFEPSELAPTQPVPYTHLGVLHFGLRVADVHATLAEVEARGGSRVFDPATLGRSDVTFCYCRDPDGNVIELADGSMQTIVGIVGSRESS